MGIVAKLSECIASKDGNILAAEIFVPHKKQTFYSRRLGVYLNISSVHGDFFRIM